MVKILNPFAFQYALEGFLDEWLPNLFVNKLSPGNYISASNNKTPILFILASGVDPTESIISFCQENSQNLFLISLGQGQIKKTYQLIEKARETG